MEKKLPKIFIGMIDTAGIGSSLAKAFTEMGYRATCFSSERRLRTGSSFLYLPDTNVRRDTWPGFSGTSGSWVVVHTFVALRGIQY